jgi:hypothetical protein
MNGAFARRDKSAEQLFIMLTLVKGDWEGVR